MTRLRTPTTLFGVVLVWGCAPSKPPVADDVPTIPVDLGTVDVGDLKDVRASIPTDDRVKSLLGSNSTIRPNCDNLHLTWAGSGPNYVLLSGFTRHVSNCDGFGTTASVIQNGKETAVLDLHMKVRRAFDIEPVVDGRRYKLKIAKGFGLPSVVDHSEGVQANVRWTGPESAEMSITHTKPSLVPGGMIRLMDWNSRDSQVLTLPLPTYGVSGLTTGHIVGSDGKLTVSANGDLTADKRDVEVVLDPPGAYQIQSRSYVNGKLTLTLQSASRTPGDLCIGFKRQGKWVDIERYQVDSPQD